MRCIARFFEYLLIVWCVTAATTAVGQSLELPTTPTRPELHSPTWCDSAIETIQEEMRLIQQEMRDTGRDRIGILEGRHTYRRLIENLLVRGQRAGWTAAPAIVAAIKLMDSRLLVDTALEGLAPGGEHETDIEERLDAVESVALFVTLGRTLADSMPVREATLLDRRLADVFQPLAEGLSILTGEAVGTCWPTVGDIETATPPLSDAPSIDVSSAMALLPEDDPAREVLKETVSILERGIELAPLRRQSMQLQRALSSALSAADAVLGSEVISDAAREAYRASLSKGIIAFRNGRLRQEAADRFARLQETAETCRVIESIPIPRSDRRALAAVWVAMDRPGSMVPSGAAQRGLQSVLRQMHVYRTQPPIRSLRDVRAMNNQLGELYEDAERRLLGEVGRLSNEPDLVVDPSFATLLTEHNRLFEAIERVRAFPEWIDLIERIDAGVARSFQVQLRKINKWLLTSSRQGDAMRVLKSLADQVATIESLPDETALTSPTPVMDALMDGRGDDLAATIRSVRAKWAQSWAKGDAGSQAAVDLGTLAQVMTTMIEVAALLEDGGGGGEVLQRWAPWCLSPQMMMLSRDDLLQRLRLATTALVQGQGDAAKQHIEAVQDDIPLPRLTASVMVRIRGALDHLPVGSVGAASQVAFAPSPEAWGVTMRLPLGEVAWMSREARHARATGRIEEAEAIEAYVNETARELVRKLVGRPLRIPRLHGFDGSDPLPTPDDMSPMQ